MALNIEHTIVSAIVQPHQLNMGLFLATSAHLQLYHHFTVQSLPLPTAWVVLAPTSSGLGLISLPCREISAAE